MKAYHVSDLHYCEKHLPLVDAALGAAIDDGIAWGAELFVFSGDSYDAAIALHHPAVGRLLRQVHRAAEHAPVFILQGTFSHDKPGCLEPFKYMRARFPVYVCERAERIVLRRDSSSVRFENAYPAPCSGDALVICGLPSVNRAEIRAEAGDSSAADYLEKQFAAWAPLNVAARASGIPSILVSHGTVNGCVTESKQAMVSQDHEFGSAALFSAETDAVLLGHIHAHQSWSKCGQHIYAAYEDAGQYRPRIAYPGSIARLINGHDGQVGALRWDVTPAGAQFTLFETPGHRLIDVEFSGVPNLAELTERLKDCRGAQVRVRYQVDEEHRRGVDDEGIKLALQAAGLHSFKVEAVINPVQRTRAAGISVEPNTEKRLRRWCELTNSNAEPLVERLRLLEAT